VSSVDLLRAFDQVFDEDIDVGESTDPARRFERLETLTAGDLATPDPLWVAPDAAASEVAQIMRREGVHHVLVGSAGRIEGILTSFDLLAAVR